jgi:hypothetical protein
VRYLVRVRRERQSVGRAPSFVARSAHPPDGKAAATPLDKKTGKKG